MRSVGSILLPILVVGIFVVTGELLYAQITALTRS